jgi:hypothetical protein
MVVGELILGTAVLRQVDAVQHSFAFACLG